MMKHTKKGFTLIELLVVIAIIALLMGLLLPALSGAMKSAKMRKDQAQLNGIIKAFMIYGATDLDGYFPLPSHIDRKANNLSNAATPPSYTGPVGDLQIPGTGLPDWSLNTTGNMYSAMIAQRAVTPEILVSPLENNPTVIEKGDTSQRADELVYNYEAYDTSPEVDQYWDPVFSGDVEGLGRDPSGLEVCHASYATLAMCGERRNYLWKLGGGSYTPILSSRGTKMGAHEGEEYTNSLTLLTHGVEKQWEGIWVGADASAHYAKSMWPEGLTYTPKDSFAAIKDNIFNAEFADFGGMMNSGAGSGDIWMVMSWFASDPDTTTTDEVFPAWDALPE